MEVVYLSETGLAQYKQDAEQGNVITSFQLPG